MLSVEFEIGYGSGFINGLGDGWLWIFCVALIPT
jgi:hypothetical protein